MLLVRKLIKSVVCAAPLALSVDAVAAISITHLPLFPVTDKPIALRIDDETISGGNRIGPHAVSVNGTTIRVEGCLGTEGLPIGGPYAVTLAIDRLAPGTYTVEYYRNVDFGRAQCEIGAGTPPTLRGSGTLTVAAPGPAYPPAPGPVRSVYEYMHYGFGGHFFMTADEDEKLAIETGRFPGWTRYGPLPWWTATMGFGLLADPAPDRVPLCRFFSAAFAPKSSHFYTANAAECDLVKQNPIWTYEGIVAYVWPTRLDGSCDQGLPLYRLYSARSGAPNHFYTESEALRDSQARAGWVPEGVGKGVIACVPARP